MNTEPEPVTQNHPFLYFLEIFIAWRKFILINVILTAVLVSGITLLLPNYYKSTASILPPKQQDIFGSAVGASSLLKGLSGGSKLLGGLGKTSGTYNYLAILKSRTTMDAVINKFHLLQVYGFDENEREKAIKMLEENTAFEVQDDENITIDVYDKDPQRASDMANYFVSLLNITGIQLGTQEAKNNREFIERRLIQCREDLRKSEEALKVFQEKKEIFISDNEKASSIMAYADLYALKAKKEIEIAVLEKTVSPDNQSLKQLRSELSEISKKVSTFPQSGLEGIRLYREMLIQSKLLEFLLPIYEQAKIDEQKDVPVLLIIDNAVPANKKAKPHRSFIVILVTFFVFAISMVMAFSMHRIMSDESHIEIENKLRQYIAKVLSFYKMTIAFKE